MCYNYWWLPDGNPKWTKLSTLNINLILILKGTKFTLAKLNPNRAKIKYYLSII